MQKIIDAEKSDIFDVLSYVAYASPPLTREIRAGHAKASIRDRFSDRQQPEQQDQRSPGVPQASAYLREHGLNPTSGTRGMDSFFSAPCPTTGSFSGYDPKGKFLEICSRLTKG
jgi:hypothetical protein